MPSRHNALFYLITIMVSSVAWGQSVTSKYSLLGSSATVTTTIREASSEKEQLLKSFLFETVAAKLRTLPMVTGVEFNSATKAEVGGHTWSDYWEHKRTYPATIRLALPTAVTLMVRVEETFRVCKSAAEKGSAAQIPAGDDLGIVVASTDCMLNSSVKITGPYTVYGNFATNVNVQSLMKEKQSITFSVTRDWSNKSNINLETRFALESELFESSLIKFLEVFNVSLGDKSAVIPRNQILLGVARLVRVQNERMVE